jgi:hypothetical protein
VSAIGMVTTGASAAFSTAIDSHSVFKRSGYQFA